MDMEGNSENEHITMVSLQSSGDGLPDSSASRRNKYLIDQPHEVHSSTPSSSPKKKNKKKTRKSSRKKKKAGGPSPSQVSQ